jgi:hypothetical protein
MKSYGHDVFENIQLLERMGMAISGIAGLSIVIIIDTVLGDLKYSIMLYALILLIEIIYQAYNYKTQWNDID